MNREQMNGICGVNKKINNGNGERRRKRKNRVGI